jgi:hypothetical protein
MARKRSEGHIGYASVSYELVEYGGDGARAAEEAMPPGRPGVTVLQLVKGSR